MDTKHDTCGIRLLRSLLLAVAALWIGGCESPSNHMDISAMRELVGRATVGALVGVRPIFAVAVPNDVYNNDFKHSAAKLVDDIGATGVFDNYQGRQPIIGVSGVVNNTAERIDTAILTEIVMSSLSDKAKVMINRGIGSDGKARYEDYLGSARAQEHRFREDAQNAPQPDLTLSGEFKSWGYAPESKTPIYRIYLRLTDGETVVWQGDMDAMGYVLPKDFNSATGPREIIGHVDQIKSVSLVRVSLGSAHGFSVGDKLEVVEKIRYDARGVRTEKEERVIAELQLLEVREKNSDASHAGSRELPLWAPVRRKVVSSTMR